eukprot:9487868-Pyramimonas_sp.AAC.1
MSAGDSKDHLQTCSNAGWYIRIGVWGRRSQHRDGWGERGLREQEEEGRGREGGGGGRGGRGWRRRRTREDDDDDDDEEEEHLKRGREESEDGDEFDCGGIAVCECLVRWTGEGLRVQAARHQEGHAGHGAHAEQGGAGM